MQDARVDDAVPHPFMATERTTPMNVCKGTHIRDTLVRLQAAMPNDDLRRECERHMEKLSYSAPELFDERWHQVYAFLTEMAPTEQTLRDIWNDAMRSYPK